MSPQEENRVLVKLDHMDRKWDGKFANLDKPLLAVETTCKTTRELGGVCGHPYRDGGTNPNIDHTDLLSQLQAYHRREQITLSEIEAQRTKLSIEKWKAIIIIVLTLIGAGGGGAAVAELAGGHPPAGVSK